MSDMEENTDALKEILAKVNRCNKNVKTMMELLKGIDEKIPARKINNQNGEQKPIGRPAGNYESKRQQYLEMLNSGKITTPKEQTLEYYRIVNLDGKFHLQA